MESAVRFVASVFHRLLEPLDRPETNRIVARHAGNRGVGSGPNAWTCQRHLKTMLFAQFADLASLREIEQALAAHPGGLYHLDLRLPQRSTLADAQAARPAAVFRDICQSLMRRASRSVRREGCTLIQLVDASPIPLRDLRFGWAEADNRTRGLKLHVGYDPRADVTDWIEVTSPKVSDLGAARAMSITAGAVYVFDKGYVDYNWWRRLHDAKAVFVSRLKSNSHRREVVARTADGVGILADNDLKIGHAAPRGGARNALFDVPLREVVVARNRKPPLRLITNDLVRPAEAIAALYKERWQIELLFKWIKQNLISAAFSDARRTPSKSRSTSPSSPSCCSGCSAKPTHHDTVPSKSSTGSALPCSAASTSPTAQNHHQHTPANCRLPRNSPSNSRSHENPGQLWDLVRHPPRNTPSGR